jgi:hypothetical protein
MKPFEPFTPPENEYAPPNEAGAIVSMIEMNGKIIIACQYRLYEMRDGEIQPIKFIVEETS